MNWLQQQEIYRDNDKPYYYTGNKVLISICAASVVVILTHREVLRYINRKKKRLGTIWVRTSRETMIGPRDRGLGTKVLPLASVIELSESHTRIKTRRSFRYMVSLISLDQLHKGFLHGKATEETCGVLWHNSSITIHAIVYQLMQLQRSRILRLLSTKIQDCVPHSARTYLWTTHSNLSEEVDV